MYLSYVKREVNWNKINVREMNYWPGKVRISVETAVVP
jgi:hypothetical protein